MYMFHNTSPLNVGAKLHAHQAGVYTKSCFMPLERLRCIRGVSARQLTDVQSTEHREVPQRGGKSSPRNRS